MPRTPTKERTSLKRKAKQKKEKLAKNEEDIPNKKKSPVKKVRKSKPTYAAMIKRALRGEGRKYTSAAAICKYIEANYPVDPDIFKRFVRIAIRKGLDNGTLIRHKASYRLSAKVLNARKRKAKTSESPKKEKQKRATSKSPKKKQKKEEEVEKESPSPKKKKKQKKKEVESKKEKESPSTREEESEKEKEKEKEKEEESEKEEEKKKEKEQEKEESEEEELRKKKKKSKSKSPSTRKTKTPRSLKPKKSRANKADTPDDDEETIDLPGTKYDYVWQYYDSGWKNYLPDASDTVEEVYQNYKSNRGDTDVRAVKSGQWEYMVDFMAMKQTNIQHENHTIRNIRRRKKTTAP